MKTKVLLVLCFISLFSSASFAQSVTITGKKVTYKRPHPIMDHKLSFTVNYPKVKAASPALARKIESSISYEKVLGVNVKEELTEIQWLEEADYELLYNNNGLLCIDLSVNGSGAYPSGSSKTVVVDLGNGRTVTPSDVFTNLNGLVALVRKAQKKEIAAAIKEIKSDPLNEEPDPAPLFANSVFKRSDLDGFSINDKGVTFTYDYGFPHVIQALQPEGKFFFSWKELKPYIRRGGLLSRIAG